QRAQQAKLTQALSERKKTLAGLESSIQQGQQQLSELRANESRLRNSIARAEAAAKARAEREAREAQAVRDRQKEATRKGTTYKPTESEKSLMSRTQVRAGQPIALVGSSGGQGRPSLYFEIRRQGQAVNPQPWLGR
ncbi:peptidoglycan DD-metalloendopeptidase family protein, partial [Escherichia coli]